MPFLKTAAPALVLLFLICSCEKAPNCASELVLVADNTSPIAGSSFTITAPRESSDDLYQWNGPGVNEITSSNTLTIDNAKVSHRGVYSVQKGNTECNTSLSDTIFINVQLPQGDAPCTTTNNVIVCSNIPGVNVTSATQSMHPVFNGMALFGSGSFGYPSFTVLFNSYNGNVEPEDGIYKTKNVAVFSVTDEPNTISVSFLYSSNYYHCQEGANVYVKHINGKLSVTFCNLVFGSSPLPNTTCSGTITEL